jgi:hypothetical protein
MRKNWFFFLLVTLRVCAQDNSHLDQTNQMELTAKERFHQLIFTTPAYRREALRLIIEEANRIAQELNLPEQLPIVKRNLVETYIPSPQSAQNLKSIGNVATSNYYYAVYSGGRFSVGREHLEDEYEGLKAQYLWPMSQLDTNAAYQLATQCLTAAAIDVKSLNRDCRLGISEFIPEGINGQHFVPVYWVRWSKISDHPAAIQYASKEAEEDAKWDSVAGVELLLPTKTLRQLYVDDPKFILRKPVVITNVAYLLSQTNEMIQEINQVRASQKEHFEQLMSTNSTLREAVRVMVEEANHVAEELNLPEQLPITTSNLLQIHVYSPKTASDKAVIGSITAGNYEYSFFSSKGFGVGRTDRDSLWEAKYHWPLSRLNTNAAYHLATQWLAAVSMDVKGLNRDFEISVEPELPPGNNANYFVPVYRIIWSVKGVRPFVDEAGHRVGRRPVAYVELFLPTKTLRELSVKDPKYILRKPLEVPNLDYLLSQTNAPAETNLPAKQ